MRQVIGVELQKDVPTSIRNEHEHRPFGTRRINAENPNEDLRSNPYLIEKQL